MRTLFALISLLAAAACGGGGSPLPTGPSAVATSVEFQYAAIASTDPLTASAPEVECSGVVRIFPSWWGFTHATMIPAGRGKWAALFEDVPVGDQRVRVEPPPGCSSSSLIANRVDLTLAGGDAFALTVHPDGSVTP